MNEGIFQKLSESGRMREIGNCLLNVSDPWLYPKHIIRSGICMFTNFVVGVVGLQII